MTEQRVLVTAGHVDHGKSTLVRALTGTDPDRLAEERRRGLTIELGFAWCDLPAAGPGGRGLTVAFVDVPGHERFVGTMLAGAGPAPAALLVVAADDGWAAQTEEHAEVLALLEVPLVAVALTKIDTVDATRVDVVADEVTGRLASTRLAGAPLVRVDAPHGDGLDELRQVLTSRLRELPAPVDRARPRLWVDRVFGVTGAGTVVTGTLGGGRLAVGDALQVLPSGRPVRVRGLQSLGRTVERALPGTRVAVNLAGIGQDEIVRGDAVVGGEPWRATDRVEAIVRALPGRVVDRVGAWRVHAGAASVPARVLPLTDPIIGPGRHAEHGRRRAVDGSASTGAVRLLLAAPLPLVAGDRLVLREAGRRATVAGGQVADPAPGPPPRGRAARERRTAQLLAVTEADGPAERLSALLALAGGARPGAAALAAAGVSATGVRPPGVVAVGGHAVLEDVWQRWADAAATTAGAGSGVAREALVAAAAAAGAPAPVAAQLPDQLVHGGRLVRTATGFATPGSVDDAVDEGRGRTDRLLAALVAEPFSPPDLTTTARALGIDHREVNRLVQAGAVVRTGEVAFAAEAVVDAAERLVGLEREVGPFTAAQAKTVWGTTRRFAIPLLEHLDRTRVTTFDGRLRTTTGRRPPAPPAR